MITFIKSYLLITANGDMYPVVYRDMLRHKCKYTCSFCKVSHTMKEDEKGQYKCTDCHRTFPSMTCNTNDKKEQKSCM